ncbi:MAG: GTP-binding protein [Nitrospira sp.]|nr:GTP-binding protein [Nitrospira sp.]
MPRTKSDPQQEPTLPVLPQEGSPPPLVAIIGRPNVGKSTLFNKILGAKIAIVDDVPGVTRDRNYADATYRNRKFRLVDTGGLDLSASDSMLTLIRRQSELAIAEADILIALLDGRSGLTPRTMKSCGSCAASRSRSSMPSTRSIHPNQSPYSPTSTNWAPTSSTLCRPNMASGLPSCWMPSIHFFRRWTIPISCSSCPVLPSRDARMSGNPRS